MIGAIASHYVASSGGGSYSAEVMADSPLAYWRMGDPSGTTCTDSSGNARHATYAGAVVLGATGLITGDTDTAVDFPGATTARAEVASASWMNVTAGLTLEAVVKVDSLSTYRTILDRDSSAGGRTWGLRVDQTTGKVTTLIWSATDAASSPTTLTSTSSLAVGTKYHVAVTWDGTTVRIYINGTQDASVAKAGSMKSSTTPICIAVSHGGSNLSSYFFPMDGIIDEAAIYGTALSAGRVAAHAALV